MKWLVWVQQFFSSPKSTEVSLKSSTAELMSCLWLEIALADDAIGQEELGLIRSYCSQHLGLDSADVLDSHLKSAREKLDQSVDYYHLTQQLNDALSLSEKQEFLSSMWAIAHADGTVSAQESHVIQRLAGLLHLRHSEQIAAKQQASRDWHAGSE